MTGESYFYRPGPDSKAHCHAFATENAGVSGFGASLLESFTLRGSDPRFPAPEGSWCVVLPYGATPPPGFQPAPEPSAAALATMAETCAEQSRLLGQLIDGLADLNVSAFTKRS